MLYVPSPGYHPFRVSNLPATPGTPYGTVVAAPATANTMGSWVQLLPALSEDIVGLYVMVNSWQRAGVLDRSLLMDIGIDPAGGASYSVLITNINVGAVGNGMVAAAAGERTFWFPIRIPAGATVAARVQSPVATAANVSVAVMGFGGSSRPEAQFVGSFAQTLGAVPASSRGTVLTPGNGAFGSYTSLGTTTEDLSWWQFGLGSTDASMAVVYTHYEVAFGDATNKSLLLTFIDGHTSNEYIREFLSGNLIMGQCYCPLPAGTQLWVRALASGAPDTGINASVIGVG
jgi:hypothetical protein